MKSSFKKCKKKGKTLKFLRDKKIKGKENMPRVSFQRGIFKHGKKFFFMLLSREIPEISFFEKKNLVVLKKFKSHFFKCATAATNFFS